jgi:hypothetical protein
MLLLSHGHHALLVALRAALVAAPLLASRDDVVDSQEQNCGFNSRFVNLARTNILEYSLNYHKIYSLRPGQNQHREQVAVPVHIITGRYR